MADEDMMCTGLFIIRYISEVQTNSLAATNKDNEFDSCRDDRVQEITVANGCGVPIVIIFT